MSLQQEIIKRLGVKPVIDVDEEIRRRVDFLKEQVKAARTTGLLIAISGGIDSAVTTGLCKRATDELTQETGQPYMTLGVFQPYGKQEDIEHSYEVAKAFGLEHTVETNIEEAVDEIALEVEHSLKNIGQSRHLSPQGKGNVKARTRMVMQYALAFELTLLVVGTDHASEAITGFYTKWGDGAVDVTPLSSRTRGARGRGRPGRTAHLPAGGVDAGTASVSGAGIASVVSAAGIASVSAATRWARLRRRGRGVPHATSRTVVARK